MKNIAITGCFSAGKSFVLSLVESMGYKVFSCDEYVKKLYENENIKKQVVEKITKLSVFDKKKLSNIIYDDEDSRKDLGSIIHPLVRKGIKDFENKNKSEQYIFTEVPLLFENNFATYFAYSICVFCSEEARLLRAKQRGVLDMALFYKINRAQMSQDEKKQRADFTINSEKHELEIKKSIEKIIEEMKNNERNSS